MFLRRNLKRSVVSATALSLFFIHTVEASDVDEASPNGEILEYTVKAPSLEGNLLGTPTEQAVNIYLPPSYETNPSKRYPVLYLLHGFHGTDRTWLKPLDARERPATLDSPYKDAGLVTAEWLNSKFEHDDIPEMIVVAPNGRNKFKHTFWINSVSTGNWSDYVAKDLVTYIDQNFRTLPQRESRAIAGHSGGANGSLQVAMQHPGVFASVYAMAPCCLGPTFSSPDYYDAEGNLSSFWREVFGKVSALEDASDLPGSSGFRPIDFYTNLETAAAAAFSPNKENPPFYSDFAFDRINGEFVVRDDVVARRRENWSYYMVADHAEALRGLNGLMIDTGELESDELRDGAAAFVEKLTEHQIPVRFEVYADGDHGNLFTRRMMTLGMEFFRSNLATDMVSKEPSDNEESPAAN